MLPSRAQALGTEFPDALSWRQSGKETELAAASDVGFCRRCPGRAALCRLEELGAARRTAGRRCTDTLPSARTLP